MALLGLAACAAVPLYDHSRIGHSPLTFGLLIALTLVLDTVRIDIFERGNISPATVPAIALAYLFGPVGPICGEAIILVVRLVRPGRPAIRQIFDFGLLSMAGIAAAAVFSLVPVHAGAAVIGVSVLAALSYYVVNATLLCLVWMLDEGISPFAAWVERLAWLWPHTLAGGAVAGLFVVGERSLGPSAFALFFVPLAMAWLAQKQYVDRSRTSVEALRASHRELEVANEQLRVALGENEKLLESTRRAYMSTITSLARTIEAKDPYTGGHTERVAEYALMLARELGFGDEELKAVEVGAVIHDIGKIGIPDRILLKPGRLNAAEVEEMRRHPEISSYILDELDLPPIVRDMARNHHERFDDKGYPDGLAGKDIPLAARILTVADAFDAMTSDRPYRRALSQEVAAQEIRRHTGTQFCPDVVAALEVFLSPAARAAVRNMAPAVRPALGLS
ncbi:MAG TPA: HD domain-containing phosphohydrolase [Thermoleophilaceae bacterium]|nr:HD domain-containing phosphohydrolase [Thermoleophilaceae bacterium]